MLARLLPLSAALGLCACGQPQGEAPAEDADLPPEGSLAAAFENHLLRLDGDELVEADTPAGAEYLLFYFSAHWCAPCRVFTPQLVEWYQENHREDSPWEIVFVSHDRSAEAMADYLREESMPWLALDYDFARQTPVLDPVRPYGIPATALMTQDGRVLSHSIDAEGNYQGPSAAVETLEALLAAPSSPSGSP